EGVVLLQASPRLGRLPVGALANMLNQGILPRRTIRQVAIALASDGIDPFIPAVGVAPRIETEREAGVRAEEFEIIGVGAFRGDRLVEFATLEQARGVAWLVDEAPFAVRTGPRAHEGGRAAGQAQRREVPRGEALMRRGAAAGSGRGGLGGGIKAPNQISPQLLRTPVELRPEVK